MSIANTSKQELITFTNEDAVALFPEFRSPPEKQRLAPLRLPLCLPQGTAGSNAAFTRAYNPELRASGVEMDDWLRFVDGLNIAMSASPPLRVVELSGVIIGFVPHHWAMIAGASIQFAAETSIRVIAKTLTDRYLRRVNAEYFASRGLRVRICTTAAMRQIIGRDPVPDHPSADESTSAKVVSFAKDAGRIAETIVLHLPVIRKVYNRIAPSVPSIPAGQDGADGVGGMTARRIAMIEDYTLPLSFDVPPPLPEEGLMNKASGLSVRVQTYRARQAESKAELDWRQARKDARAEQRALRRAGRGRVSRGLQSSVELADRLEWKATRMLLWVVLLNAEQDAQIQGRELVDNDSDVEKIAEEDWAAGMQYETAEDKQILEEQGGGPDKECW